MKYLQSVAEKKGHNYIVGNSKGVGSSYRTQASAEKALNNPNAKGIYGYRRNTAGKWVAGLIGETYAQ